MADYQDPGWGRALRAASWVFIPFVGLIVARRSRVGDGLTQLRVTFLAIVAALVFYLAAFAFIEPWDRGGEGWVPIAVLVLGLACLLAVAYFNRRPLRVDDRKHLADSYRASFFICAGMAESAALFGICGIFIGRSLWIYLVGLPFSLAGFVRIAPTRANIERRQEQIQALGSPLSLGQALLDSTPPAGTE